MIIVLCNTVIEEVHVLGSVFPCRYFFKSEFSLQVQRCLSGGDTPAVNAPAASKALAWVLSAVPHGECKENSFSVHLTFLSLNKQQIKTAAQRSQTHLPVAQLPVRYSTVRFWVRVIFKRLLNIIIFLFSICKNDFSV